MTADSERRSFIGHMLEGVSKIIRDVHGLEPEEDCSVKQWNAKISGDLAPELLAMEAERMGLDPNKDRQRIIASLEASMTGPPKEPM